MTERPQNVPLAEPRPDAGRFIDVLMGRAQPDRVPLVEYLIDDVIRRPIVTELLDRAWADGGDRTSRPAHLDNFIAFWHFLGYDFVRYEQSLGFPARRVLAPDTAPASGKERAWLDEHQGAIQSWQDFEQYSWPTVQEADLFAFEYIDGHLPEGMGLMTCHAGGMFETLSLIMSIEGLCLALYDCPDLVQAVSDRVGALMLDFYRYLLDLDSVVAIFQGDDMGFRSGTLVAPSALRQYVLPWHRRFARMAHERGIPYFLHSCGSIEAIMEDLVEDVGIDGKHSYEDAILPAESFQARYGDRIAVLGGVDVDILARRSPGEVRQRTRSLIETCGERGRYAVGSGNSIPSYIPVANYLAMVDEANG